MCIRDRNRPIIERITAKTFINLTFSLPRIISTAITMAGKVNEIIVAKEPFMYSNDRYKVVAMPA